MKLYAQIKADQLQARKDRDTIKAKTLTGIISDSTGSGVDTKTPTDDEIIVVIRKHLKGLNETKKLLGEVTESNREHCIVNAEEIHILESYLPQTFTDEEVRDLILFEEKNIGKIMGLVKKAAAEQGKLFDGAQVQRVIKTFD